MNTTPTRFSFCTIAMPMVALGLFASSQAFACGSWGNDGWDMVVSAPLAFLVGFPLATLFAFYFIAPGPGLKIALGVVATISMFFSGLLLFAGWSDFFRPGAVEDAHAGLLTASQFLVSATALVFAMLPVLDRKTSRMPKSGNSAVSPV